MKLSFGVVAIAAAPGSPTTTVFGFLAAQSSLGRRRRRRRPPPWRRSETALLATAAATSSSRVRINEDATRDVRSMEAWASASGVARAEGFRLTGEYEDGRLDVSASTEEGVAAGDAVLSVPSGVILSSFGAMEEFGRMEEAEEFLFENGAWDEVRHYYLMLKVMAEWERGEESPWFHYLNSLPRYFTNAASMTPFCHECIPPLVASLAEKERSNLHCLSVKWVPFLSDDTNSNAALWKWAFQVVYTRSFEPNDGSGDLRIAPMADMLNHGTEAEIELAYDEYGNCHAMATKDILAGSPLRMSYGDPTNPSFLFARYGFLDESSPATFCKIMPTHVSQELWDMGYSHDRMLFYKDTGDVSEEVWDVLLYLALSNNELKQLELYQAHMNGDYETKRSLHEQYHMETSAKLLEHIDTSLNQLDELSGKANGGEANGHPRLPLILRHNEFVRNTFLAVRSRHFQ